MLFSGCVLLICSMVCFLGRAQDRHVLCQITMNLIQLMFKQKP